jgi:hypothetical protein
MLPAFSPTRLKGVNTKANAMLNGGGMNVQTIKLNVPAKNPINAPAIGPISIPAIVTGIIARVATMGPKAGKDPSGVKHTIASIANITANSTKKSVRFCLSIIDNFIVFLLTAVLLCKYSVYVNMGAVFYTAYCYYFLLLKFFKFL